MTAEIAYNQSDFAYRKEPGVNQSSLKKILDSPAHYQAALKNKLIPTPAMKMGTAAHCLVLDGEAAFDGAYVKKPDNIKLTTKEGKEWKASVGRKTVLNSGGKDDPWGSVQGMAESLKRLEWYSGTDAEYIKRNEVSIYWDWLGVRCKARLDSVLVDEGLSWTSRPLTPWTPNCSPRRWSDWVTTSRPPTTPRLQRLLLASRSGLSLLLSSARHHIRWTCLRSHQT